MSTWSQAGEHMRNLLYVRTKLSYRFHYEALLRLPKFNSAEQLIVIVMKYRDQLNTGKRKLLLPRDDNLLKQPHHSQVATTPKLNSFQMLNSEQLDIDFDWLLQVVGLSQGCWQRHDLRPFG